MAPAVAAALISAIPAIMQTGQGMAQSAKANKLAKAGTPQYMIPQAALDNSKTAKGAYMAANMYGLPGQGRIENRIGQNTAAANQAIVQSQQSPAAMLAGISSVNQNANNAIADLGVNAAQYRQQNMMATMNSLMSARDALARYQDRQFEINKLRPFEQQMAAAGALRAGGIQNVYGGLSSLSNTGANYYLRNQGTGNKPVNPQTGAYTPYPTGAAGDYLPPSEENNYA